MKNMKALSDSRLLSKTKQLAEVERKITTKILWHLHEISSRRLYAGIGYSSLFEYAVKELDYSEGAAGRRIAAMQLLVVAPEIVGPALQNGNANLSTLCTLQSYFRKKEEEISLPEKKELLLALQGMSKRECEKKLASLDPQTIQTQDRERVLTEDLTEIRFVADEALLIKLKTIRALDAHVQSHLSYLELFHRMADLCLRKLDVTQTKARASKKERISDSAHASKKEPFSEPSQASDRAPLIEKNTQLEIVTPGPQQMSSAPPAELENPTVHQKKKDSYNPRAISAEVRRQVWVRDEGKCQFKGPSGQTCGSRFALQIDHINPVAWGGRAQLTNLQLLCHTHNQWKAKRQLGFKTMEKYWAR